MKTSKKKKIIIGSLVTLVVIAITLVLLNEWGNREHEKKLEAIKLEQELEAQKFKEQQEQEEKERQEKLAKLEEGWNALGENQECLALGSEHLKRLSKTENGKNYVSFDYDVEFIDSLYMINDGWFQGVSKEDLIRILSVALVDLPDNATGKEVYNKLCDYIAIVNRDAVVTGEGTDVLQGLIQTDPEPNQNNQSSNNNNDSNSNSSNKNNNTNNNNQQNSNNSSNNNKSDEEAADDFASQFGGSGAPDGDPILDPNEYGSIFG